MKNKETILAELQQFYGTMEYHRHSILFSNLVLTDGAKHLADSCECYWLFDIVGSVLHSQKGKVYFEKQSPVVVKVTKNQDDSATVSIGNEKRPFYSQKIEYTDFPLDTYSFYVGFYGGGMFVAMLFSEN